MHNERNIKIASLKNNVFFFFYVIIEQSSYEMGYDVSLSVRTPAPTGLGQHT